MRIEMSFYKFKSIALVAKEKDEVSENMMIKRIKQNFRSKGRRFMVYRRLVGCVGNPKF